MWVSNEEEQQFYGDKIKIGAVALALKSDRPIGYAIRDRLIRSDWLDELLKLDEFSKLYQYLKEVLINE